MEGSCDYGHFDIVLADFLKEKGISKNQLSEKANLQRTQLNSYCKNNIPIPNAPAEIKQEIHKMVIDSYALRDESNRLLDEAMDLLVQELKLPPIEEIGVDDFVQDAPVETFLVKLSQLNNRADASYHVPIVKAIVDYLNKNAAEVTTIGDCKISRNVILPG